MSKKWDKEELEKPVVVIVKSFDSKEKIDVQSSVEKTGSLVVPLEEYTALYSSEHESLLREYRMGQFPDLFSIKNITNDDVESLVPALRSSRPVKIFAALYEAKFKSDLKKSKNKLSN